MRLAFARSSVSFGLAQLNIVDLRCASVKPVFNASKRAFAEATEVYACVNVSFESRYNAAL